ELPRHPADVEAQLTAGGDVVNPPGPALVVDELELGQARPAQRSVVLRAVGVSLPLVRQLPAVAGERRAADRVPHRHLLPALVVGRAADAVPLTAVVDGEEGEAVHLGTAPVRRGAADQLHPGALPDRPWVDEPAGGHRVPGQDDEEPLDEADDDGHDDGGGHLAGTRVAPGRSTPQTDRHRYDGGDGAKEALLHGAPTSARTSGCRECSPRRGPPARVPRTSWGG